MIAHQHDKAALGEAGRKGIAVQAALGIQGFHRQRWCLPSCRFRAFCPGYPASMRLPTNKKGKHPCHIKAMGEVAKRWFLRIYVEGEAGLSNLQREIMFRILGAMGRSPTLDDLDTALGAVGRLRKDLYPSSQPAVAVTLNLAQVTVEQVKGWQAEDVAALLARLAEAGMLTAKRLPVCQDCIFASPRPVLDVEARTA